MKFSESPTHRLIRVTNDKKRCATTNFTQFYLNLLNTLLKLNFLQF